MTKLYNHAYFQTALKRAFTAAVRHGQPLSLIMADIDDFKRLNDTHGHPYGDKVLIEIARVFSGTGKSDDLVARYGGEEFAVIVPQVSEPEALALAESMRLGVEQMGFPGQRGPITMSFGVATTFQGNYPNDDALLKAAEDHMYLAKHGGKNHVSGA